MINTKENCFPIFGQFFYRLFEANSYEFKCRTITNIKNSNKNKIEITGIGGLYCGNFVIFDSTIGESQQGINRS